MSEPTHTISQGSAPVAIVLALALAATVAVSAQRWDAKPAAPPPTGQAGAEPVETRNGATLIRLLVDWARGRTADCSAASSP